MVSASEVASCAAVGLSVAAVAMSKTPSRPDTFGIIIPIFSGICAFTTSLLVIEIWQRKRSEESLMNSIIQLQQAVISYEARISEVEDILMSSKEPPDADDGDDDDDDDDGDDDQPPRGSDREIYYSGGRG